MTYDLTNPIYNDEEAARKHFEALRWPAGTACPHCGVVGKSVELQGKSTRPGVWKCRECRKPFTATVGTVYERSHIPLHKWLLATHLLCASKKGISAHQLWRMLGFGSYKTAWFMAHRIREAMVEVAPAPLGGGGGIVEVDETYIGLKSGPESNIRRGLQHKRVVLTLVERGGKSRTFHVDRSNAASIVPVVRQHVKRDSALMTDEAWLYDKIGKEFASHERVKHISKEYARGRVNTNTVEGFFSIFKRGFKGIYQHCGEHHLHRYLTEFDFRYSNRAKLGCDDDARTLKALRGVAGKRLTYEKAGSRAA